MIIVFTYITYNVPVSLNAEHVFSVETMVCGYHGTRRLAWDALIENLCCEREVHG